MIKSNYEQAKNKLGLLNPSLKELIKNDDSLQQFKIILNDPKERSISFDWDLLKIRIIMALFLLTTLSVGFYVRSNDGLTLSMMIYIIVIVLAITLLSTITRKITIIIDFRKKIVIRGNRKIKFQDSKKVFVEKYSYNFIPVSYIVVIKTSQGKVDFPLLSFPYSEEGKSDISQFTDLLNQYIINYN